MIRGNSRACLREFPEALAIQVREEIAHLLTLGVQHGRLRIAGNRVVEIPAHRDDETACVQEAVLRAVGHGLDISPVDVVELALQHAVKSRNAADEVGRRFR
jgi:hypothetical protein